MAISEQDIMEDLAYAEAEGSAEMADLQSDMWDSEDTGDLAEDYFGGEYAPITAKTLPRARTLSLKMYSEPLWERRARMSSSASSSPALKASLKRSHQWSARSPAALPPYCPLSRFPRLSLRARSPDFSAIFAPRAARSRTLSKLPRRSLSAISARCRSSRVWPLGR